MTSLEHRFTLYAHQGKVFAENSEGTCIELGRLHEDERGKFDFRLKDDALKAYGFFSLADALANLGSKLTLPYMQDQFASAAACPVTATMRRSLQTTVLLTEVHEEFDSSSS